MALEVSHNLISSYISYFDSHHDTISPLGLDNYLWVRGKTNYILGS